MKVESVHTVWGFIKGAIALEFNWAAAPKLSVLVANPRTITDRYINLLVPSTKVRVSILDNPSSGLLSTWVLFSTH